MVKIATSTIRCDSALMAMKQVCGRCVAGNIVLFHSTLTRWTLRDETLFLKSMAMTNHEKDDVRPMNSIWYRSAIICVIQAFLHNIHLLIENIYSSTLAAFCAVAFLSSPFRPPAQMFAAERGLRDCPHTFPASEASCRRCRVSFVRNQRQ